ncbi:FHA domain-containing protein [Planctomyces sp. SH-PL14]|uniref:FHA domain-containing protein n=1 Tax=Planctomyces sp. SH-PL14 TaxID=1632864 RepID=UPI00078C93ED|nr:FHA domain-containing protein [Planctomyces sp. SH-PL14]AMV18150.1 hypothetical protein VT03_09695 [Planctomyces sp. SH-PL14]
MGQSARIVIHSGPDRGRVFPVEGDLVHIGRGTDNAIVLADPEILDYHFSVSYRNGQCALNAAAAGAVVANGQPLPPDQWVAVVPPTKLQVSGATELEILANEDLTASTTSSVTQSWTDDSSTEAKRKAAGAGGAKVKKKARSTGARQVAKFITDRPGDPLVRLGGDGKLPELALTEKAATRREAKAPSQSYLIWVVMAVSVLMSVGMLLIDAEPTTFRGDSRTTARRELASYYRGEVSTLQPYQIYLRNAVLAHAQGDAANERKNYFRVLDLLDAADIRDPANLNGLTGKQTGRGRSSDIDLRRHLEILVAR